MKLTIVPYNLKTDIETKEMTGEEAYHSIVSFLNEERLQTVYVCFQSYDILEREKISYEDQYPAILITHDIDHVLVYYRAVEYGNSIGDDPSLLFNWNIFEFESYEDALMYCRDLKEGL